MASVKAILKGPSTGHLSVYLYFIFSGNFFKTSCLYLLILKTCLFKNSYSCCILAHLRYVYAIVLTSDYAKEFVDCGIACKSENH